MARPRATSADARGDDLARVRRTIARRASPLTSPGRTAAVGVSSSGPGERMAAARANGATGGFSEFLLSGFGRTYPIFGQAPDSGDYVAPRN
jgi:hypothetical protein